jgi:hypothetical protein
MLMVVGIIISAESSRPTDGTQGLFFPCYQNLCELMFFHNAITGFTSHRDSPYCYRYIKHNIMEISFVNREHDNKFIMGQGLTDQKSMIQLLKYILKEILKEYT